jgi:hypothetical protein
VAEEAYHFFGKMIASTTKVGLCPGALIIKTWMHMENIEPAN